MDAGGLSDLDRNLLELVSGGNRQPCWTRRCWSHHPGASPLRPRLEAFLIMTTTRELCHGEQFDEDDWWDVTRKAEPRWGCLRGARSVDGAVVGAVSDIAVGSTRLAPTDIEGIQAGG